jgi:hypothetical protein
LLTCKNQAYASLKGAAYHGPCKAYTYQQHVALHQDAHNELEDCIEAVPETKKVADFLAGISCPLLQMGLNIVMSDPMKLSNFDVTKQFLGTLVANQANLNCIKNDERGISAVETFKKSNKLKKGKRGKGTGGKRLKDRFYQKDEWNRLTQEQCKKVTEMTRERKKRAGDSAYSRCKTATAESSDRDENENTDAKNSPGENGGNEFGRSAHKKKGRSQKSS